MHRVRIGNISSVGWIRRVIAVAAAGGAVVGASLALFAAGTPASASTNARAAAAACGEVPTKSLPPSTGNLLASLPASVRSLYVGYGSPVLKSVWSNWKPKTSKLVIGVSFSALDNPFATELYGLINSELRRTPGVKKVISFAASSPTDVTGQIQQYTSLVQQHVNLIVLLGE